METSSGTTETPAVFRKGRNLQLVNERPAAPDASLAKREQAIKDKERDLQTIMVSLNAAFRILSGRSLVMAALLASIGLFGWACVEPNGWRVASACLFAVIVFLPALWADARQSS